MDIKKIVFALYTSIALVMCGCAAGGSAPQSTAKTVEFKGVQVAIPATWIEEDVDKGTIEAAAYWRYGNEENFEEHGYILAYSELYETYGNTDTQMPDPSDPKQQEIKEAVDQSLKALDARIFMSSIAEATLRNFDGNTKVDQSVFHLEERQGHAVWFYEWKTSKGTICGYCIPLDKRMVAFFAATGLDSLTEDQRSVLDSITVVEESNALILERAHTIEGMSQDDAMSKIVEDSKIPPSAQKPKEDNKPTGYKKPTEDTYTEYDGDVYRFGEDGSITRYDDDLGITTFNEDGSKEWTDGWGTVVRDVDGDGNPDYVSYDSGETWYPYDN